jgi:hypothetical protein
LTANSASNSGIDLKRFWLGSQILGVRAGRQAHRKDRTLLPCPLNVRFTPESGRRYLDQRRCELLLAKDVGYRQRIAKELA